MVQKEVLSRLPAIDQLLSLSRSLAALDAILCPTWEYRCFSFNSHWHPDEMMASMRNGSGDSYFILFTPSGAILKGFAHEAVMSPYRHSPPHVWQGVLDAVPSTFAAFLSEPAFVLEETTFCVWRTHPDAAWQQGNIQFPDRPDPDGSRDLLSFLDGNPETYRAHAEANYGVPIPIFSILPFYRREPLTKELVNSLNPKCSLAALEKDLEEIGYPGILH